MNGPRATDAFVGNLETLSMGKAAAGNGNGMRSAE